MQIMLSENGVLLVLTGSLTPSQQAANEHAGQLVTSRYVTEHSVPIRRAVPHSILHTRIRRSG